jgi:O-antigen biosynthesis protein
VSDPHGKRELERALRISEREEQAARREVARLSRKAEDAQVASQTASTNRLRAQVMREQVEAEHASTEAERVKTEAERVRAEFERRAVEERAAKTEAERARAESEQGAIEEREARLATEHEADRLRTDIEGLLERGEELEREQRGFREELIDARRAGDERERELEDLRGKLSETLKHLERAERLRRQGTEESARRQRELQQTISALSVGMSQVKGDIDRAAASRAWRYGHGVMQALARLARRPQRTEGALAAASARILRVEGAARALPATASGHQGASDSPRRELLAPTRAGAGEANGSSGPVFSEEQLARILALRGSLAERIRERLGPVPERASWPRVSAIVPTRDGRHHLERLFASLIEHTDYPDLEVVVVDNSSSDGSVSYLRELRAPFPIGVIANRENRSFADANAQGAARSTGELLLFLNNDVEAFESGWLKELVCALDAEGVAAVGATLLHPEERDLREPPSRVQHRAIRLRWQDEMVKGYNDGDGEELWNELFAEQLRAPAVTAACMLIARKEFERVHGFESGYLYGTEDVDLCLKLLVCGGESAGVGRAVLVHRESSSQNREGRDFRRLNRLENRRLFMERWGPQVQREYRLGRLHGDRFWTNGQGPHVAVTLTSLDVNDGWGDWYSGHEIGDALQAQGWRVTYVQRKGEQWYELPEDIEYVLSLMDSFDLRRVPEHITTIAWIRNWTERWLEQPWFERADVLLASSGGTAELIERTTGRRTIRFPLAVNPDRFRRRSPGTEYTNDYVFTGNWWGKDRDIQQALAPLPGERVAIYGRDWDKVAEFAPYARGELPYTELPRLYAEAKLVLDDTQGPTLPYGAVNARVFDALAAGTLPVTNCEAGVRELFDDEFPVWSSKETLRRTMDRLLADEELRVALARRYRELVLGKHTYAHRAAQLRDILVEHEQRLSFCLKIGAPNREVAPLWGDLHFARSLAAELRRRGHRSTIQTLDEWDSEEGLVYDVVVHLKGLSDYHPKPAQFNVLWSISHPDRLSGEECDAYDLVCAASSSFADVLRADTGTPVTVLEQATDPWVMRPDPCAELAHDLVYVANSRGVLRPIARDLLPTEHDLAIWGSKWDGLIDTSRVIAENIPNDELRQVYSSAGIVLNDHWDDMREHGYISNRIYDALACGALVLSDEVPGLTERFGDAVACYSSPEQLQELIDRFLEDPQERRRRAELGREVVLGQHTFAHRVDELLATVEEHMSRSGHRLRLRTSELHALTHEGHDDGPVGAVTDKLGARAVAITAGEG